MLRNIFWRSENVYPDRPGFGFIVPKLLKKVHYLLAKLNNNIVDFQNARDVDNSIF